MEAGCTVAIVIERILGLLREETISFRGLVNPDVIESLKLQLKMIHPLLKDADKCDEKIAKRWVEKVAYAAQRLESIIDTCLLRMVQRSQPDFIITLISALSTALEIQIQHIIKELQQIIVDGEITFQLSLSGRLGGTYRFGEIPFFMEKYEELVTDFQKEQLLSVLVGEPSEGLVVSLVGSGGVGKTTLACTVYRDEVIQRHFEFRSWIRVSKSYNSRELLRGLTLHFCTRDCGGDGLAHMDLQEIISHLNRHLFMKRYLIVFDDVSKIDFWEDMNQVFPDESKGSRIIITTRNKEIAAACDIVQDVQPFSEQRALELFCKRAFRFECPPEFEELSLEFVRNCHGLPLVIGSIADFLSTKNKVVSEWRKLLHQFNDEAEKMPFFSSIAPSILSCSYDDLPFNIRPCFSYFGLFPKGYLVPDIKLYQLWIAEGFVKEEKGKTLEQVAATYLNELINRNFVQVSYINYYGIERICRVPSLMHDIIFSRAEAFGIGRILNEGSSIRKSRYLSIHGDTNNISKIIGQSQVRSVFLFSVNELMTKSFMTDLIERFKFLELLDFENAPLGNLPNEVGNLFFLKYLCLRNTKVKKLPKSIGLLLNLQTLDVRNTLIHELPIKILKLRKLQHLLASTYSEKVSIVDSVHGVRIKEGIGCLENLQTLLTVEALSSGFDVIEELASLRQLRRLSVSNLTAFIVKALCISIQKMNHLEFLSLNSANGREVFDLEAISSPPPSLRRLILKCRLEKLPDWILKLTNLCVLSLSFSRLVVDPLKALYCLPNLESLWLHQAYIGEQLHFEEGCFQKLKQLVLTELYDLRMMRIEGGALPLLEELRIGPSPHELSSDIQHLRNLQVLEYYDMPSEFVLRFQPEGGSDYWKVEHVPSVRFWFRVEGRRYMVYKLGEPHWLDHLQGLASDIDDVAHLEVRSSFYYSDDDDDSAPTWNDTNRLSFSSNRISFFSDDIVD